MSESSYLDLDFEQLFQPIILENGENTQVRSPESFMSVNSELNNINFDNLQVIHNDQSNEYWVGNFSEEETKAKTALNHLGAFPISPKIEPDVPKTSQPSTEEESHVEVLHPMTKVPFLINKELLGRFLVENGRTVETFCKNSPRIQELVESFCDHTRVE